MGQRLRKNSSRDHLANRKVGVRDRERKVGGPQGASLVIAGGGPSGGPSGTPKRPSITVAKGLHRGDYGVDRKPRELDQRFWCNNGPDIGGVDHKSASQVGLQREPGEMPATAFLNTAPRRVRTL